MSFSWLSLWLPFNIRVQIVIKIIIVIVKCNDILSGTKSCSLFAWFILNVAFKSLCLNFPGLEDPIKRRLSPQKYLLIRIRHQINTVRQRKSIRNSKLSSYFDCFSVFSHVHRALGNKINLEKTNEEKRREKINNDKLQIKGASTNKSQGRRNYERNSGKSYS